MRYREQACTYFDHMRTASSRYDLRALSSYKAAVIFEEMGKKAAETKSTKQESESEMKEEEDAMEKAVREQRESHQKRLEYLMNPFGPELEEQGVSEKLSKKVCSLLCLVFWTHFYWRRSSIFSLYVLHQ